MRVPVREAARIIEGRGLLERRRKDQSARVIAYVSEKIGRELPEDLVDFYRECIDFIDFARAIVPVWNDHTGWSCDFEVDGLLAVDAVPLFWDGCGSIYGLDLAPGDNIPAVYFFDHEGEFAKPEFAAGSSLGVFMLLLADHDRALREKWPRGWELKIDPDLDSCPRAPAIWRAG